MRLRARQFREKSHIPIKVKRFFLGAVIMIKYFYKDNKSEKVRLFNEFRSGCWIHVESPTPSEITFLREKFNLSAGLLRDALDIYEVPRLEIEEGQTYIFTRFAYWQSPKVQLSAYAPNGYKGETTLISTEPVLIILGDKFLMTFSLNPLPFMKDLLEDGNFYTTKKISLFFKIFVKIHYIYNTFLHNIARLIRSTTIELEKINNKDIIQFVTYESVLNDFLTALEPTNVILKNLFSGKFLKLTDQEKEWVEDLYFSNSQLIELSQANLRNIVNIREAYSTIITNNLNRVIRLLTSLTVILAVPTMIASIYGMNIDLPFDHSPNAFFIIISAIVFIASALLFIFLKKRWL